MLVILCHVGEPQCMDSSKRVLRIARAKRFAASGEGRRIRKEAGLSQPQLADPIGVDPATLCRWESGKRSPRGEAALLWLDLLEELDRLQRLDTAKVAS